MHIRGKDYRAVWMDRRDVVVIDQRLLPHRFALLRLHDHRATAEAIRNMTIRGAGTIGATAGYGLAQACLEAARTGDRRAFAAYVRRAHATLLRTRPTAADLQHAIDRVLAIAIAARDPAAACSGARTEAGRIADEYVA